jgi:hypothetical protein
MKQFRCALRYYPGGTYNDYRYSHIFIDDVSIYDFASLCFSPQNLNLGTVTDEEVTINWEDVAYNSPVDAFEWELRTEGTPFTSDQGLTTSGSEGGTVFTKTIPNLDPGTYYTFYLRSKCDENNYSDVVEISFGTLCSGIKDDIDQDFNTNLGDALPLCWTSEAETGSSGFLVVNSSSNPAVTAYGGSGKMLVWESDIIPAGNETRLISPALSTLGLSSLYYNFKWFVSSGESSATSEGVQVQYSIDNGSSWIPVGNSIPRYGSLNSWTNQSFVLPAEALDQGSVYIGFLFSSEGGQNCYLDAFEATTCLNPSDLTVTFGSNNYEAVLTWSVPEVLPSVGYDWEVRTSGEAFSTEPGLVAAGSKPVDQAYDVAQGLVRSTNYTFYLRSDCGSGSYSYMPLFHSLHPHGPYSVPLLETFASSSTPADWFNTGPGNWKFSTSARNNPGDHTPGGGTNYAWYDGDLRTQVNGLLTPVY